MSERQIHPAGAVLLLQEALGVHTETSAKSLHGGFWQQHYNPNWILDSQTILQDPQKSSFLVNTIVEIIENAKKRYIFRKRHITLDGPLFYRFGLLDGNVHPLEETSKKYGGGVTTERMRQILEADMRKFKLSARRPLARLLPENLYQKLREEYPLL